MFSMSNFKTEQDVAAYIGKAVGRQLGYEHLNLCSYLQETKLIRLYGTKGVSYLNLFIVPNGGEWKVSAIGIIVDDDCFNELTEEEAKKLWKFGTSYIYDHKCISMCDITGVDLDTICSYVTEDGAPENIIIGKSDVARRKKVSSIINEWFITEEEIKKVNDNSSEDMKQFAKDHNVKTDVVDRIATAAMYAKRCVRKNVSYNGGGTDLKVTISLLAADNKVFTLYLCVDEVHVGLFYLLNEKGNWQKKLLPDSIGEVADLFLEKTR